MKFHFLTHTGLNDEEWSLMMWAISYTQSAAEEMDDLGTGKRLYNLKHKLEQADKENQ